jgi:hypothetical protein
MANVNLAAQQGLLANGAADPVNAAMHAQEAKTPVPMIPPKLAMRGLKALRGPEQASAQTPSQGAGRQAGPKAKLKLGQNCHSPTGIKANPHGRLDGFSTNLLNECNLWRGKTYETNTYNRSFNFAFVVCGLLCSSIE